MKSHSERLEDLFFFARDVLGYDRLGELHLDWFDTLLKEKAILLLAPPGHYKTTACTIIYPLFRLTEDANLRGLLVNEVLDNAKGFLREIKGHIVQNERFRERYGHWDLAADSWTEERIQIPRTQIRKEPSLAVASVLGTVVSQHPDLIIIDDPCSNRNTQTTHQRLKIINWFLKDLMPRLDDGGQIIVVMTRWHSEDLAGYIKSDEGFSDWKVIDQAADWIDEAGKQHILFPEKFTTEKLAKIRRQLGTPTYNLLYRNNPAGQEGSDFKLAWIDSGRYDKLPDDLTLFAGVDLAIGKKEKNSRFSYTVIGIDGAGTVYLIDAYRDRIPFSEQLKTVKRIHRLHSPRLITVETNAYQAAFTESLRTDPETRRLPLRDMMTTGDKHARIRGLSPLFENGVMRLPRAGSTAWVEQLEEELSNFPNGSDDMLDSLWLALQGVELQRIEPRILYAEDAA